MYLTECQSPLSDFILSFNSLIILFYSLKHYNLIFLFHILEKIHTYSCNNINNSDNVNYNNTNINNLVNNDLFYFI